MPVNERWHILTVEETEKKLNTNIHAGLTNKDAAARRSRKADDSVFVFPQLSPQNAAKMVMNDVALYFFFFVALVCAVLQMWVASLVAVVIIAVNCTVTVMLKITSNKYENAVMAPSLPRVDVLREGRVISIDGRAAVIGDIIMFKKGDVLPCDVRIVRSNGLSVHEAIGLDENGSVRYARSRKLEGDMPLNARLPIDKISNMVFAGSMVTTGSAVGIVVERGKNTYIGRTVNGIEMRSAARQSAADETVNRLFRFTTIGLFAAILPFILVNIFSKNTSLSPLDAVSQTTSLAVSLPLQTITVLYSTVICCAVRLCARPTDKYGLRSAVLKNYSAIDRLNSASKLFLFGEATVCGGGKCIECAYTDQKRVVSAENSDGTSGLGMLFEYAFLINKACTVSSGEVTEGRYADNERLILRSMAEHGIDSERLVELGGFISYKRLAYESAADAAIASVGNDFAKRSFLVCRCFDNRIIECANWYSSGGVDVKLDDMTRDRIHREYDEYKRLGYEVISIAKAAPRFYDNASFDDYEDNLVFVGMIAIGPCYSRSDAENVASLSAKGLHPVMVFSKESEENVYTVRNLFKKMHRAPEIVKASELSVNGTPITEYPNADAYMGFSRQEIATLISHLKGDGIQCACTVVDFDDLAMAGKGDFIIAYSNDSLTENGCTEPYPAKSSDSGATCSAGKRYADMLVKPVSVVGGGLDGILHSLTYVRGFFKNLEGAVSYLISSLIVRMLAVYLPLIFGTASMNAAMILYLGCIVDLAAILVIACTGFDPEENAPKTRVFSSVKQLLLSNVQRMIYSAICTLVVVLIGFVPIGDDFSFPSYFFIAVLLCQLSSFVFVSLRKSKTLNIRNLVVMIAMALAVLLITLLLGAIPGINEVICVFEGLSVWIKAVAAAAICAMIEFVSLKNSSNE